MLYKCKLDARNAKDMREEISKLIDGQIAFVQKSYEGDWVIVGFENQSIEKEYYWLLEQDEMFGVYIDNREGFDRDYDSNEYEPDFLFGIDDECVKEVTKV